MLFILFFLWDGTAKVKFQKAEIKCLSGNQTIHCNLTVNEQDKCQAKERRRFSCDNNHRLQTQPNVGHTEWDTRPKVNLDHLNLSNRCLCPLYLPSAVLSKKHTMSLVRCISSAGVEPAPSLLSAGFMRIDPFIPKWTLKSWKKLMWWGCLRFDWSRHQKIVFFLM